MLASLDKCSGCAACAAVCPQNCISMIPDHEGFRYPKVDTQKCVECRLCQRSCPILTKVEVFSGTTALAAKNNDTQVRQDSSSGGVFTALAEAILKQGGAVCAARYDADHSIVHSIAENQEALSAFRGAKYAQSRAEHCFKPIQAMLQQGKPVLFVGTPCQCAGLKAFLKEDYKQLLTVDMVCHGVPSPMVWQKYLQERSEMDANGVAVDAVNLRSKESGWSHYGYSVKIAYKNGSLYCVPQGEDPFMQGFVRNLYLRPSCADCAFKGLQRCSDLTLGDFWGIWDLMPEFDDDRGVSLLLFHTEKGRKMWEEVCGGFDVCNVQLHDTVKQNPSVLISSAPHPLRQAFFESIKTNTVIGSIHSCLQTAEGKLSLLRRIWNRIRR